uniref:Hedgehog/Intein (Hint) domain-containing protein n=1 Tax=endosymbiont of Ridgeia piscesae TaxID=54398 RepID=D2CKZ0_9GAMM|nr:hypothetical protein [endosymbiont of Ridgeia piscesae]
MINKFTMHLRWGPKEDVPLDKGHIMNYPHRARRMGIENNNTVPHTWTARPDRRPLRALPRTRRYEVAYLGHNTEIADLTRLAPAMPIFEDAFCAMARGSLIATIDGPVAIEDLLPGTLVHTRNNGPQPVLWIGSMSIAPNAENQTDGMGKLSRITADSFGLGRPMPDLLLGPRARLFRQDASLITAMGTTAALAPITAFVDGDTVLEITPPEPVRVYHLAFERHQIISANGLEIESYHPGSRKDLHLTGQMRALFLAMFPHVHSFSEFGPLAYPRLSFDETQEILAA